MIERPLQEGLTFDDVLLVPAESDVLPAETDVRTLFSRNIQLNVPIISAAMDTVTESGMAIALAQQGGIGIIHKNMSITEQADEADKVKRSESGMIVNPITMSPDQLISDALAVMQKYKISGVPITQNSKLVGILTNRDLRFETNFNQKISQV
ncbi:IMP dehydrogenase, partial [bacterium]|nr:IMP dehydrogenase [bacterium]